MEDENEEAWSLDAPWYLAGTLADDVVKKLSTMIEQLREDTSPKGWAERPAKSRRSAEEHKVA